MHSEKYLVVFCYIKHCGWFSMVDTTHKFIYVYTLINASMGEVKFHVEARVNVHYSYQ